MSGISFRFSGLTEQQEWLLTYGGWTVDDADIRPQPREHVVAELIERGLLIKHQAITGNVAVTEYQVPVVVHIAWCEWCASQLQEPPP